MNFFLPATRLLCGMRMLNSFLILKGSEVLQNEGSCVVKKQAWAEKLNHTG